MAKRIEEIILKRITHQIGKKELEDLFDISLKQGGAGLNRRTAKRFTRELELILME